MNSNTTNLDTHVRELVLRSTPFLDDLANERIPQEQLYGNIQLTSLGCSELLLHDPEREELVDLARRILDVVEVDTSEPIFYMLQGHILQKDGHLESAAAAFVQAASVYDQHADSPQTPQDLSAHVHALDARERAFKIRPTAALAIHIGESCIELDRPENAIYYGQQAHALSPDSLDGRYLETRGYLDSGQFGKASEGLEACLLRDPIQPTLHHIRSHLPNHVASQLEIDMLGVLRSIIVGEEGKAALDFTLGRNFQKLGKYEEAFNAYRRGNNIVAEQRPASQAGFAEEVDTLSRIQEAYLPEHFQDYASFRNPFELRPLFIFGMPRSGTSLVERILAAHRDQDNDSTIYAGGENMLHLSIQRLLQNVLPEGRGPSEEYLEKINMWSLSSLVQQYGLNTLPQMPQFITNKTPQLFNCLDILHLTFSDAPMIHCTRDGLDNCVSLYTRFMGSEASHMAFKNDLSSLGEYYTQYYEPYMELWDRVLPEGRIHTVSYEALVNDPEKTIGELLTYLNLDWSDQCMAHHEVPCHTGYDLGTSAPIYKSSVGVAKHFEEFLGPLQKWFE